jgi:hypothetical protein
VVLLGANRGTVSYIP